MAQERESLNHYRRLIALTDKAYRKACSVHSSSRRIPFLGAPDRYTHWRDCLPAYERELAAFERNLAALRTSAPLSTQARRPALPGVPLKLVSRPGEMFTAVPGAKQYTDRDLAMEQIAPELRGLTGVRIPPAEAAKGSVRVALDLAEPGQLLVGFFRSEKKGAAASPPKDEWEPVLRNAIAVPGHPGFSSGRTPCRRAGATWISARAPT